LQRKTNFQRLKTIGVLCFSILGIVMLSTADFTKQEANIGVCAECHGETCADFRVVQHAAIEENKWTNVAHETELICANCHGDPAQHIEAGGEPDTIFSFLRTEDVRATTQKCLNCHSGTRAKFFMSPHGKSAMDCISCHSDLMTSSEATKNPTKVCLSCHEEINAQFQLNERHRLQEGIMECTTCHDQHAPSSRERLGGFKDQACLQCHNDKGGPFLFEHEASTVEGCTTCHEVHGTPNRHMLTHQSTSDLCFSCHTGAVSWHSRFSSTSTNCAVCHSTIHGSNLSRIFLK